MAAKKKTAKRRAYKRRAKPKMTAASMEGYTAGVLFARDQLDGSEGVQFLVGHSQGVQFVLDNAPKKKAKKRAAYGSRKAKAAAKA